MPDHALTFFAPVHTVNSRAIFCTSIRPRLRISINQREGMMLGFDRYLFIYSYVLVVLYSSAPKSN